MSEFENPPAYDPPPPYRPPPTQAPPAPSDTRAPRSGGSRSRLWIAAAVVAALAGVLTYLLAFASSSGATSAKAAVQRLLDAGRSNDTTKAESVLCAGDRALGELAHLQTSGTILSYRLGGQNVIDGITVVQASYTTSSSPFQSVGESFPVVKQKGSWKVCFTALRSAPNLPATGSGPLPIPTDLLSNGPTGRTGVVLPSVSTLPGGASLCSGSSSGYGAASTYLGAVALRVVAIAQACVYHDAVPQSVTSSLSGILFRPQTSDQNATVINFVSVDGAVHVTVTTTKEPDGIYYVTDVKISR